MRRFAKVVVFLALAGGAGMARADDAAAGKASYTKNCVVCHGIKGTGNGPLGKNLNPKPTDFTSAVPDDALWFKAIKSGTKAVGKSSAMTGFGSLLTDAQIHDVLAYVKAFKSAPTAP
jgi:high-affinity iron transporter